MKTEQEIRKEIELNKQTLENYKNAYKKGEISKDILDKMKIDCASVEATLLWVLEENERYD